MNELDKAIKLLASSPITLAGQELEHFSSPRDTSEEEHGQTREIVGQTSVRQSDSSSLRPTWQIPEDLVKSENDTIRRAAANAYRAGQRLAENMEDFDRLAHFGLRLQELAASMSPDAAKSIVVLLRNACEIYEEAYNVAALKEKRKHSKIPLVVFNWAIALSDIARFIEDENKEESIDCFIASASKYAEVVSIMPTNARAFNNWGLVMHELARVVFQSKKTNRLDFQTREKHIQVLNAAVSRFRAGLYLQNDLALQSRICYNLATVLHKQANIFAGELLPEDIPPSSELGMASKERKVRRSFAQSGLYIILAFALQPAVRIYQEALESVTHILPLPYLYAGRLKIIKPSTLGTSCEQWVSQYFGIDARALQSIRPPISDGENLSPSNVSGISFRISDIISASICLSSDLSLPEGHCIWLQIRERDQGIRLIAETEKDAQCWVDAVRLLSILLKEEHGERIKKLEGLLLSLRRRQTAT